jgi:transcriptional regulator with XRE-family HTH domain
VKEDLTKQPKELGIRCRKARELAGFSKDYVAGCVAITRTTLLRIERGEILPSERVVSNMVRIYQVDNDWLRHGKAVVDMHVVAYFSRFPFSTYERLLQVFEMSPKWGALVDVSKTTHEKPVLNQHENL